MTSAAGERAKPPLFFSLLLLVGLAVLFLGGCGGSNGGVSSAASTSGQASVKTGGTMSVATDPATNRDPHFASARSDILINQQVYDWLVEIDQNNTPQPELATAWESADGKTWTFTLRSGVVFSNGTSFTAEDVVYSFDRLRDPKVGTPVAGLYENIASITAIDATHVRFSLTEPNPEFPADVGDYHSAILSRSVADPAKEWIGTGPFTIVSYAAEDRAVLEKNPHYWGTDEKGGRLPYLDRIDFVFLPDQASQVNALLGGQVQFNGGLTSALADSVKSRSNLELLTGPASAFHYVIHMRSDPGRPTADVRVRQALQLGTDHQGLIDQIRPGLAVVGNGTPVGPAYAAYFLDRPPSHDPDRAKQLLAEAGHPSGLSITLYAQDALEVPAIATVWKAQMAKIGVNVNIQVEPADVYYGEGDTSWLKCDFGITEWGARATPAALFNVAYVTDGAYNESHWSDAEFDGVVKQINREMDPAKRAELYKQAQEILMERGPVIVPFFEKAAAGVSATMEGITIAPDWSRTLFRTAHFTG